MSEAVSEQIPVRFEVRGKVVDVSTLNRPARRILEGQAEKYRRKYADTVGPDGERPTIVVRKPDLTGLKVEVVLEFPEALKASIKGADKAVRVA